MHGRNRPPVKARRKSGARKARRAQGSTPGLQEQVVSLTRELKESREEQTATSEVLKIISSSPGELKPVFDAILENATRICEAKFGNLFLYADNSFRIAAQKNAPPAYAERWRQRPVLVVGDNPHNPLDRLPQVRALSICPT